LVVAAPVLGLILNMEPTAIGAAILTLLAGTPALTFIGAAGAAITVSLPRGGLLVSVLILPLAIPVLIFGVSATLAAVTDPDPFLPPFLILCALTLFFAAIGTAAAVLSLKSAE
jgi:heme exporter protein B